MPYITIPSGLDLMTEREQCDAVRHLIGNLCLHISDANVPASIIVTSAIQTIGAAAGVICKKDPQTVLAVLTAVLEKGFVEGQEIREEHHRDRGG